MTARYLPSFFAALLFALSSCADSTTPSSTTSSAAAVLDVEQWGTANASERAALLDALQRDVLRTGMSVDECRDRLGTPDHLEATWAFDLAPLSASEFNGSQSLRIAVADAWPVATVWTELDGNSRVSPGPPNLPEEQRERLLREIDDAFISDWCSMKDARSMATALELRDWVNHARPPVERYRSLLHGADRSTESWSYDVRLDDSPSSRVPQSLVLQFRDGVLAGIEAPL